MNAVTRPRGGAPVAVLTDLGPIEAGAVRYLRLWFDGPVAQSKVWNDFARLLGAEQGRAALKSFETLCAMCIEHGRRPLTRHDVECQCVGADESCFANFVACAAEGDREYAMLIATLLVRPDMAPSLMGLAADVGLSLKRMALKTAHSRPGSARPRTIH